MATGQEVLAATQSAVAELERRVLRLAEHYGETLGVRRLRSDVGRFQADLAELGDPEPGRTRAAPVVQDLLRIDDRDYDPSFWEGVDDEGLGAADRTRHDRPHR